MKTTDRSLFYNSAKIIILNLISPNLPELLYMLEDNLEKEESRKAIHALMKAAYRVLNKKWRYKIFNKGKSIRWHCVEADSEQTGLWVFTKELDSYHPKFKERNTL
jgi:hypothetical protein